MLPFSIQTKLQREVVEVVTVAVVVWVEGEAVMVAEVAMVEAGGVTMVVGEGVVKVVEEADEALVGEEVVRVAEEEAMADNCAAVEVGEKVPRSAFGVDVVEIVVDSVSGSVLEDIAMEEDTVVEQRRDRSKAMGMAGGGVTYVGGALDADASEEEALRFFPLLEGVDPEGRFFLVAAPLLAILSICLISANRCICRFKKIRFLDGLNREGKYLFMVVIVGTKMLIILCNVGVLFRTQLAIKWFGNFSNLILSRFLFVIQFLLFIQLFRFFNHSMNVCSILPPFSF